jgi:hypothetical protein
MRRIVEYSNYIEEGQEETSGLLHTVNRVKEALDKLREASMYCKNDPRIDENQIMECYENLNRYYENLSMQAPYVDSVQYGKIPNTSMNILIKKGDS